MSTAPRPTWTISYEGAEVSNDLSAMVVSLDYVDHLSPKPPEKDKDGKKAPAKPGEKPEAVSDELALTLEDVDGRWRAGWWPAKGDKLVVQLGYLGQPLLDCGTFEVDEVELGGAPDVVALRAQSTPMSAALRTAQSRAFGPTTLQELVGVLAAELELAVVGEVAPTAIARVTQGSESTLAFLRRLAGEYGYTFAVRPPSLVFYPLQQLEKDPPVATIDRTDLLNYRLKSSVAGSYAACVARYFDAETKELREVRVDEQFQRQRVAPTGAAASAGPPVIPSRTLSSGLRGDDVRSWQSWVSSRGIDTGPIDGIFGPLTATGVRTFQQQNGLAVDGIIGPETWRVAVEQGYSAASALGSSSGAETAGAILRLVERFESVEAATAKATAALAAANRVVADGSLSLVGDPTLVAGRTIELTGMGRLSGRFLILDSTHRLSRSGYTTELEVRGV